MTRWQKSSAVLYDEVFRGWFCIQETWKETAQIPDLLWTVTLSLESYCIYYIEFFFSHVYSKQCHCLYEKESRTRILASGSDRFVGSSGSDSLDFNYIWLVFPFLIQIQVLFLSGKAIGVRSSTVLIRLSLLDFKMMGAKHQLHHVHRHLWWGPRDCSILSIITGIGCWLAVARWTDHMHAMIHPCWKVLPLSESPIGRRRAE